MSTDEHTTLAHGLMERPQSVRNKILAFLTEQRQAKEIANHIGRSASSTAGHLAAMGRSGLVVRTAYACYQRSDLVPADSRPTKITQGLLERPQPVRDMILAFLTQKRQAKEIADYIGRPVPNATGHLAAMARRGLVVRTAYGCYQRSDLVPTDSRPAKITRPTPMRDLVRSCLNQCRHSSVVADLTGQSHQNVRSVLEQLVKSGLAISLGRGVYGPPSGDYCPRHDGRRSVRAARVDAGAGSNPESSCTA